MNVWCHDTKTPFNLDTSTPLKNEFFQTRKQESLIHRKHKYLLF